MKRIYALLLFLAATFTFVAIAADQEKEKGDQKQETIAETENTKITAEKSEEAEGDKEAAADDKEIKWNETKSGLKWVDLVEGEGPAAKNGDQVVVHYHLWLSGKKGEEKVKSIQNSRDPNPNGQVTPFPFTVGQRGLIAGWNEGMVGMKAGGLRRLWIPWNLGYGARGMGAMIPPHSNLVFEIELLEIKK